MDLQEALRDYREKIVNEWVDYTLSTYESSKFFKREQDKFANPTGGTVRDALSGLFSLLAQADKDGEQDPDYRDAVMPLMLLRSVQEFTPSQAVAPINAVKHIVRKVLASDKETRHLASELYDFDFKVDLAMLAAFDQYTASRERMYQLRVNEIKTGKSVLTDSKCPSKLFSKV
ncbi:MAG: hypothetical protein CSB24_05945 [Deltaproteobacteria bacterium]|nr:MAG: hypothetical protein CSB24_05945 [Deltaproteobacteria bacterium]